MATDVVEKSGSAGEPAELCWPMPGRTSRQRLTGWG